MQFDQERGLWVASSACTIAQVFANPDCVVRPPAAIAGSRAAGIVCRLVRMSEGQDHALPKAAITRAMARLDLAQVAAITAQQSAVLSDASLTDWVFALPTRVVAVLLGAADARLAAIAGACASFVRCLSPLATQAELDAASAAADQLDLAVAALLHQPRGLAAMLVDEAGRAGWNDPDAMRANLIGLLSQTHEATAGLIGNTLVALLREPALRSIDPASLVRQVARSAPSVQNTRRYVARPTVVAGVPLEAGATILLMLGEAGFGQGRHACPGEQLAYAIASAAVQLLLDRPGLFESDISWTYRASANACLPEFFLKEPQ